jgi:hypothetical protein
MRIQVFWTWADPEIKRRFVTASGLSGSAPPDFAGRVLARFHQLADNTFFLHLTSHIQQGQWFAST